eukprot:COSAG02_NODE_5723_length_4094_cov_20.899374_2_plen_314_part_00
MPHACLPRARARGVRIRAGARRVHARTGTRAHADAACRAAGNMSVLAPPSRMLLGVRVALAVACLADALAVHVPAAPVKLLPLGDSITFGCGDYCGGADAPTTVGCNGTYGVGDKCCAKPFGTPTPHPWTPCMGCSGGYRAPLESRLAASKRTSWEFVGSVRQDGGSWHEGHPGWRIDQIAGTCIDANHTLPDGHVESGSCQGGNASFFKRWVALKPDVIILMIGTNDIGQLYNTTCNRSQTPWVCSVEPIARRLVGLVNATFRCAMPATAKPGIFSYTHNDRSSAVDSAPDSCLPIVPNVALYHMSSFCSAI